MLTFIHTKPAVVTCSRLFLLLLVLSCNNKPRNELYIDPTIGNISQLLSPTRPVIQLPNQMIRVYPLRKDYTDDLISAFPLNVVGHNAGEVFCIRPTTGPLTYDQEEIHPWYYSTLLLENKIKVEFTPGAKTGFYRFTRAKKLLYDTIASWHFNGNEISAVTTYHGDVKVYMYGEIDKKENVINLRYAISYISIISAKQSFAKEIAGKDFATVQEDARLAWEKTTAQITVEGGTYAQRRSFYTALYRCHERMVNITENGAYYSGYDKKIHTDARPFYVDDATWDTYQASHPLRMILDPSQEEDMLYSYVRMYGQSGWMPTFPRVYGDHPCMNGFHSTIVFLDAYRKGLQITGMEKAYEGMKKNAMEATMLPWRNGSKTVLEDFYHQKGYYPALHPAEKETIARVDTFEKRQAVAVTLGHSYDDWALSALAKELHKDEHFDHENYRHLWNAEKGFFMPKDSAGKWIDIDPAFDGGPGGRDYYDENNGWTYLWQVQQDIPALIQLMGGKDKFEARLDELFRTDIGMPRYKFWYKFPDATALTGQFSMGNEPGFHIPYLYTYTNSPWKTQKRIRYLLDVWFKDNVFGIPGDEDGGGMSAFVVFSCMGFYPVTPGVPVYTIGSPVFNRITIQLKNGKKFTVLANHCSSINKYIQRAKMNGKVLKTLSFTHQDLINGGILELEMGPLP